MQNKPQKNPRLGDGDRFDAGHLNDLKTHILQKHQHWEKTLRVDANCLCEM